MVLYTYSYIQYEKHTSNMQIGFPPPPSFHHPNTNLKVIQPGAQTFADRRLRGGTAAARAARVGAADATAAADRTGRRHRGAADRQLPGAGRSARRLQHGGRKGGGRIAIAAGGRLGGVDGAEVAHGFFVCLLGIFLAMRAALCGVGVWFAALSVLRNSANYLRTTRATMCC